MNFCSRSSVVAAWALLLAISTARVAPLRPRWGPEFVQVNSGLWPKIFGGPVDQVASGRAATEALSGTPLNPISARVRGAPP